MLRSTVSSSIGGGGGARRNVIGRRSMTENTNMNSSQPYSSPTSSSLALKGIELAFNERFGGDFDQRKLDDSVVLKKGAPAQPVMRNEMEYVMSQASRIATGFKDLRKLHEDLLKELVLLQSQYDMHLTTCNELATRLDLERQTALDRLAESEQQRTGAILESVKVKNQKRDVEFTLKQSREIELETLEWKQHLSESEARRRELEKRLNAAELVASSQFKLVQAKQAELERVNAALLSMHRHQEEEMQVQRTRQMQQLQQSKATLAALKEQEQVTCLQLEALQMERDKLQAEVTKRHTQIALYEDRAKKAAESLASKDDNVLMALQTLSKAQESSEHRLAALKQEISLHWQKCEDATRECNQIQNELSESASQITRLQTRIDALQLQECEWKQTFALMEQRMQDQFILLEKSKQDLQAKLARVEEAKQERDLAMRNLLDEQNQVTQTMSALEQSKEMERTLRSELVATRSALDQLNAPTPPPEVEEQSIALPPPVIKNEYEEEIEALEHELATIKRAMMESDTKRRALLNQVQTIKGNIRVLARVAPMSNRGSSTLACSLDGMSLQVLQQQQQRFSFNRVFDCDTSQLEVFQEVSSFVQSALDGYHVCLLATGQRAAGKTFTIMGDLSSASARGIIPRSLEHILCLVAEMRESSEWYFKIECSYVEISGEETVLDLFGVKRLAVTDAEQVLAVLQRTPVSSNDGHRVFSLYLHGRNESTRTDLVGSLHLCDLASGGENDVSTVALASSLKQQGFKPSKLTDFIKPCLSGEGKTLMICNVTANEAEMESTLQTLRFAQQVNQAEPGSTNSGRRRE